MSDKPPTDEANPRGPGSFCVPRAAIDALLDAKANVYEICAYLVLARFTDATGRYSTASISAINRYTGANKTGNGPVARAIERLKTIHAKRIERVSNGRSGKAHAWIEQATDLGPILFERATWHELTGEVLPDGPTDRGKVLYVLPDFNEKLDGRVWFGGNLVSGVSRFDQPLKKLRHAGEVAARLLLSLYAANDMETWGGVCPVGEHSGPWKHYEPVAEDIYLHGGARLIRSKREGMVGNEAMFSRAWPGPDDRRAGWWATHTAADGPVWRALEALESTGLVYELVLVLNRNAIKAKDGKYGQIPDDAEPFYELDARSHHGFKPEGEEGIGGATANTAGALGYSVALERGHFDGTYVAIVPKGYGAMIAGIFRLRFRVANPKNAGVKGAWARIHQGNREAFDLVQSIRAANKLEPLPPPKSYKAKTLD